MNLTKAGSSIALVIALALGAAARADEPAPRDPSTEKIIKVPGPGEPAGGDSRVMPLAPKPIPSSFEKADVVTARPAPDRTRSSANAGALKDLQAVELRTGEARVRLNGAVRTVRPGDVLAGDTIREIETDRLILARPEAGGGESTVIVTFGAGPRPRVLVVMSRDPAPAPAPGVQ